MRNIVEENPDIKAIWYLRLLNMAIDIIAVYLVFIILLLLALVLAYLGIISKAGWLSTISESGYDIIGVAFFVLYYIITEATTQRTLGKVITGTIVVTEDGSKPQFRSILGRSLCRIFSLEAFSFIAEYPRGWHDSASGTYVVKAKKLKEVIALKNSFDQIGSPTEDNTNQWGL